jgi:hypothetical protein
VIRRPSRPRWRWLSIATAAIVATVGAALYVMSPDADLAPVPGLRQLDLLYLDEPAPGLDPLGVERGRPAVILFCRPACAPPPVTGVQVVHSGDADLAAEYALLTSSGRVGPGYALVDAAGQLRYRTFDPEPAEHAEEIQVLIDAVTPAR